MAKLNDLRDNDGAQGEAGRSWYQFRQGQTPAWRQGPGFAYRCRSARFRRWQMPIYRRLPKRGFNAVRHDWRSGRRKPPSRRAWTPARPSTPPLSRRLPVSTVLDGIRLLGRGELEDQGDYQVAGASRPPSKPSRSWAAGEVAQAAVAAELIRLTCVRRPQRPQGPGWPTRSAKSWCSRSGDEFAAIRRAPEPVHQSTIYLLRRALASAAEQLAANLNFGVLAGPPN